MIQVWMQVMESKQVEFNHPKLVLVSSFPYSSLDKFFKLVCSTHFLATDF